jgi:dipeptidyl aminopeptidase/acylaminoacyl peptidase
MKVSDCVRAWALGYLLTIIVFLGLAPTIAFAAPPSAFELFKTPELSRAKLSPSGRYLAAKFSQTDFICLDEETGIADRENTENCAESNKGYRQINKILIVDLEGVEESSAIRLGELQYIKWMKWASDDRLLVSLRGKGVTKYVDGEKISRTWGKGGLLSVKRDGSDQVMLLKSQKRISSYSGVFGVTSMLRADPVHVLLPARKSRILSLWKVNIETGIAEKAAHGRPGTFLWYADGEGQPILRFDYNKSRTKIYVFSFSKESNNWKKIRTVRTRQRDGEVSYDFYPVAPSDTPNHVYVVSDEEEELRRTVKLFDFKENRYVETVFEHPRLDVGGVVLNTASGAYEGAWYYDDRLHHALTNPTLQQHMEAIDVYFNSNENVELLGFDEDQTKIVLFVSGPTNPGKYFLYNIEENAITLLMVSKPNLLPSAFGEIEILSIPVRDGSAIRAYLTHPAGGKDSDAPLIVMPHGGPEVRDYYEYDSWVQFLATRGYQVLQINFRGSDGYGRAFAQAGYQQWGGLMQDDVTDAVRFLHDSGRAPADRTCILGYSYGGYAALMGGIKTPELYQCIIAGGAPSNLVEFMKAKRRLGHDSGSFLYWQTSIGDHVGGRGKLEAISPALNASKLKVPVLLFHGEEDGIVPFSHYEEMEAALEAAGVNYHSFKLKYEGHSYWELENEMFVWETIGRFLDRTLMPNEISLEELSEFYLPGIMQE